MPTEQSSEWHAANLIPTTGVGSGRDQEMRATSALLAVLPAVPEFAKVVLKQLGAPAGRVETFVEVPFKDGTKGTVRPDGLIRITRGQNSWVCLVEVKTGRNQLDRSQLEAYLDIARSHGFDALLTISNQYSPSRGVHPVQVNKSKLRRVSMHHLSWTAVITDAVIQHQHRGVSDPDQAWILNELIKYLEHPSSGAMQFEDMGKHWVSIRNSAKNGTLRKSDEGVEDVIERWHELMRYVTLELSKDLGTDVSQVLSKNERDNLEIRLSNPKNRLEEHKTLVGEFRIPDTASDVWIEANLANRAIRAGVNLGAPKTGRPKTRLSWLIRQLKNASPDLVVEVGFDRRRDTTSNTLAALIEDPALGLLMDQQINPRSFKIYSTQDMGVKKGNGQGSFVNSIERTVEEFYREVVQTLKAWTPPAPRLPKAEETGDQSDPSN